jgi:hypothetical protein
MCQTRLPQHCLILLESTLASSRMSEVVALSCPVLCRLMAPRCHTVWC